MELKNLSLFGFKIGKKEEDKQPSFAPPSNEDGATTVTSAAQFGMSALDLDGSVKNEVELITRYREMAMQPEIESAVDDIVNEAIVHDDNGKSVEIVMDELKQPDKLKNAIKEEFDNIIRLLNYDNMGTDIFRRYYIDGRLNYHVMIDINNPQKGILELRYIDPRKIKKVREIKKQKDEKTGVEIVTAEEEYFVYSEKISSGPATTAASAITGVKIAPDSIISVNSGLMDAKRGMVLSYLHKAIKPLNQLRMIEDAVVIYRLSRAPERRIFYIDVGNLPRPKAEQHVRDMMTKYKNKLVYDASTGLVRDDRRHLCLSMDTKVPLLDGRTLSLSEIAEEYKNKELWAYSCNPETGEFVPGLITWAGVSNPNAQIMRLTLDNGKTIDCTPEHRFPVWNAGMVEAKDLKVGDSMIPLYKRNQPIIKSTKNKDYEQIWENDKKKWSFTHRVVSSWKDSFGLDNEFLFNEDFADQKKETIHHKNINRFDNSPNNLVRMNSVDHILFHRNSGSGSGKIGGKNCYEMGRGVHNKQHPDYHKWKSVAGKARGKASAESGACARNFAKGREVFKELLTDPEYYNWFTQQQRNGWTEEKKAVASDHAKRNKLSERGNDAQKEQWKTPERKKKHKDLYAVEYTIEMFNIIKQNLNKKSTKQHISSLLNNYSDLLDSWRELNKNKCLSTTQKSFDVFTIHDISKIIKLFTGLSFAEFKQQIQHKNHKIAKIEYLNERADTGCLTIDGDEKYHNYHTFALDAGIYTQNSMVEDFWIPRREGKTTEITTLPPGANLGKMEDVEYFEKKLYKSLNVPVTRLDPSQAVSIGRSTEITRDELKFAKFVAKLRNKFAELFDQALRLQLVLKGICTEEEWQTFKESISYDFIKDNNFVELKEAELMQERLGILAIIDQYSGKYYSKRWIQQHVLRLNDIEIADMEKEIDEEKDESFKDQAEDQVKQIQIQAQGVELQNKLMPNPEVPVEAGQQEEQGQPQQQQKKNPANPYDIR